MIAGNCRLLTIAPYQILPPKSGGQMSIVTMADSLGRYCNNQVISTMNNASSENYSFTLHPIFPDKFFRYIPFFGLQKVYDQAKKYNSTHLFCEHPYMMPLCVRLSKILGIPWILRSQNIEAERFKNLGKIWWPIFRYFERYAMRHADAVLFITPEDQDYAIHNYQLSASKCHFIPYGTHRFSVPTGQLECKSKIGASLGLDTSIPWLYFLGAQDYRPNIEGVEHILNEIYPRLSKLGFRCEIIIAGKGLPLSLQSRIKNSGNHIRYIGFVDDLDTFITACDLMLNTLTSGGGIKTKAIEALAYNKVVVSTTNAAAGLNPEVCGQNLIITPDFDWEEFVTAILSFHNIQPDIPATFYQQYNLDAIAQRLINTIIGIKKNESKNLG